MGKVEKSFDFIVRGLEEAKTNSYHAKFADAANEFCTYIEEAEVGSTSREWVEELLRRMLPIATYALYIERELLEYPGKGESPIKAVVYGEGEHDGEDELIKKRLWSSLDSWSYLICEEVFGDPGDFLCDDVTDLYMDLKCGLRHWKQGTSEGIDEACLHWHLLAFHWSGHLYRAMSSLNTVKYIDKKKIP